MEKELTPAEIEERAGKLAERLMKMPPRPHEWPRQPKTTKPVARTRKKGHDEKEGGAA